MPIIEENYDEMVRLAEEISLLDEFNLHWNPNNLDEVFHQVSLFEQKLNDLMGVGDSIKEIDQQPLSDAHIKELFGVDTNGFVDSKENSNLSLDPFQDFYFEGYERKNKDTIYSITKSLTWYKEKVVGEIARTSLVSLLHSVFYIQHNFCFLLLSGGKIVHTS